MAQQVKMLDTKPNGISIIPGHRDKKKIDLCRLAFGL